MDVFEEIELTLWDGEPEDIYALAGMDLDYRYSEGPLFNIRFKKSYSCNRKPSHFPNCVEFLGDVFDFRDVEFVQVQESVTLHVNDSVMTSFTISKLPNGKWHGLFMLAGETFYATPAFVRWINPGDIGKKHAFAIPGSIDLEGKRIACLLNKRGEWEGFPTRPSFSVGLNKQKTIHSDIKDD